MMRSLAQIVAATTLAAAAAAQCYVHSGTSIPFTQVDDDLSPPLAMGISFPMAGAATGSYTHCVVSTNGVIFLTNGGVAVNATATQYGSVAELRGTAGASPRIAPYWNDLWDALYAGASWDVRIDTSVPGRCRISWRDTCEFGFDTPPANFQADLFDTGLVQFAYGEFADAGGTTSTWANTAIVGLSTGNAVSDPGASDLSAGPVSVTGIVYEPFGPGTIDLTNSTITFVPNGAGYVVATICQQPPASNTPYGAGCYAQGDSVYEHFADAAAAAATLTGQSMSLTLVGSEYVAVWGGGSYVPPGVGATVLAFQPSDDDGVATVALASPMPIPAGSTSTLVVHSNGNVWVGDNFPSLSIDYDPEIAEMLVAPHTGWWSWHDYNPAETGSGPVLFEQLGSVSYVTWQDVENYPDGVVNRSTMQLQFDRSTGIVTFVWQSIDGNTGSPWGSEHLVGYSPGGPSGDVGNRHLATALPLATSPIFMAPLKLAAGPRPVSSAVAGTLVTYTTSEMSQYSSGSGLRIGLALFSLTSSPGVDLGFLGAPGCLAHIATIEFSLPMVGASPVQSVGLMLPAGLPAGTTIFAQAACLVMPFSLPNGQNAFGLTTSNGVASYVSPF